MEDYIQMIYSQYFILWLKIKWMNNNVHNEIIMSVKMTDSSIPCNLEERIDYESWI